MSILGNWEQWKDFLGNRLDQAKSGGMSENVVSDVALQVGEYLAEQVEPKNEQERVLKEMWRVADENEQRAMKFRLVHRERPNCGTCCDSRMSGFQFDKDTRKFPVRLQLW